MVWDWRSIGSIGSLLATLMFLRAALRDFLPPEVQQILRRVFRRINFFLNPTDTILIDEYDRSSTNELYESAQEYLGDRCLAASPVVRLSKNSQSPHPTASLPTSHATTDTFDGIAMKWASLSHEKQSAVADPSTYGRRYYSSTGSEHRFLKLSFPSRHRDAVFSRYIPLVLDEASKLRLKRRERRLYTNRQGPDDGHRLWTHVPFAHPSTFDTLAVDTDLKDSLRNDLLRFAARRDHYARAGRAWKRGYLLHGPPGTGKTSLVAAIANLLEYDVYDLELTAVQTNSHLRRLLVSTTPKSVLVVEDVDCSLDLSDRKKDSTSDQKPTSPEEALANAGKVSLSGVLNFVDGLWSSCVGERIMVFTTNHPERLDPALLRPGRMDRTVHLSYCGPEAFRVLARNYLEVGEDGHELMPEAEALLREVEVTPAEVAEVFMGCEGDGADAAMRRVVDELRRRKAAAKAAPAAEASAAAATAALQPEACSAEGDV